MSKQLFIFASIFSLVSANESQAFLGFSDTKVKLSYACLGLDGVPISDASLSASCCDGSGSLRSNAPDVCRTSLYGAGISEATSGTGSNLVVAQRTLDEANQLKGATTNYVAASPSPESGSLAASSGVSSALTSSGSNSDNSGASGSQSGSSGNFRSASNSGAGTSAGSGGSGFGSNGMSAVGNVTGSDKNLVAAAVIDPNADSAAGAYSKSAGAGGDGSGANGRGGLYGSLFGSHGGEPGGAGDMKDGQYGDAGANSNEDLANSGKDGEGSTIDPSDYFNRIDRSASIFKIVSNRYTKEAAKKHLVGPLITK